VSIDLSLKRTFCIPMVGLLLSVSSAGFAEATDGIVVNYFSSGAGAVVIDSVGRIVTAGGPGLPGFALTRHNSDGSLDPTFGNGGVVITDLSSNGNDWVSVRAMALDSLGRILVVGNSWDLAGNNKFLLARYNPDGSLDINFGNGGLVTGDISGEGGESWAGGVAMDSLGRIVVAGSSDTFANRAKRSIALARYNSDGSLDAAFGNGGIVTTEIGSRGSAAGGVAMDSLGKIVVAGSSDDTVTRTFALARYNSDGSLDNTFGGGAGIVVITDVGTIGGLAGAGTVAIDSLGRIVAGGSATTLGRGLTSFALVRCNSDGTLDTSFGNGGKLTTRISGPGLSYWDDSNAAAIIIDSLGRIVGVSVCPIEWGAFDFELARYNSDGSLDNTFGNGGLVTTHLGDASTGNSSTAIAIDSLGRSVAAGWVEDLVVGSVDDYHSVLARFNSDGSLDNTFGNAPVSVPMITGLQFNRATVAAGSSYSVDFWGPNLTDETFFDVRFTAPGSNESAVVVNWQKGLAANHSVPADLTLGTWTINGVRAHNIEADHSANFVSVRAEMTVYP
jgi:uncharacterized delta-60 repeat protein